MATGDQAAERFIVRVPDGRAVEVLTAGPAGGLAFVYHTGTPSGLVAFAPMIEAATAQGLRSVYYSRPGYGNSDPQPGRRVADAAADVAAILDHLGVGQFVTAGSSGGGPHALATAALLPGRCLAAASLAGVAPYPAEGLDWFAGMAPENVAEFGAALDGETALTAFLHAPADALTVVTGDQVAAELGSLASAADRAALTGQFADHLAEAFRAAVSTGIAGWRDDDLAFTTAWGFSLDDVTVPLSIWQGDEDAMVPSGHGEWLAHQLPRARAHLLRGEGHLTLTLHRIADVLAELVGLAGL